MMGVKAGEENKKHDIRAERRRDADHWRNRSYI